MLRLLPQRRRDTEVFRKGTFDEVISGEANVHPIRQWRI
jgi:hypothetical protein